MQASAVSQIRMLIQKPCSTRGNVACIASRLKNCRCTRGQFSAEVTHHPSAPKTTMMLKTLMIVGRSAARQSVWRRGRAAGARRPLGGLSAENGGRQVHSVMTGRSGSATR